MSRPLPYGMILTACDEPVFVYVLLADGTAKTIEVPPGQQWAKGPEIDSIVHIGRQEDEAPPSLLASEPLSIPVIIPAPSGADYPPVEHESATLADLGDSQLVGTSAPPPLDNAQRAEDPAPITTTRRKR